MLLFRVLTVDSDILDIQRASLRSREDSDDGYEGSSSLFLAYLDDIEDRQTANARLNLAYLQGLVIHKFTSMEASRE